MKSTLGRGVLESSIAKSLVTLFVSGLITSTTYGAEYLVKYRSAHSIMNMRNYSLNIMDDHPTGNLVKIKVDKANQFQTMLNLSSDPNIEYVVPNAKVRAFFAPVTGTALKQQWAIAKVQAEKAWQRAGNKGSKKVIVAVIDTGVDYRHKSLAPNMIEGYDFARNDNDPMDTTSSANPGHGTHCAGIVGATGLVDDGIVGISPELSMMPIRFLDENGSGDLNNGIKSIDYAIEKKVDVISASWGAAISKQEARPLIEAIERAEKAGIVFVAAASNDGKDNDTYEVYPAKAATSNTIAVAASNSNDGKPYWSNYGQATVDVAAPGDAIMSTLPNNGYGNLSGTSMATPLVSGLVALIKAQDPSLKPAEIKSLLQASGAKVSIETACDCRVDAFNAVDMILSKKMFVHPQAATLDIGGKLQFTGIYGEAPFKFASSNPQVATISEAGEFSALAQGDTVISVTDAKGQTAQSYKIFVGKPQGGGGGDDGGGGGGGDNPFPPGDGECPFDDPMMCQIICQIQPDLPFCK